MNVAFQSARHSSSLNNCQWQQVLYNWHMLHWCDGGVWYVDAASLHRRQPGDESGLLESNCQPQSNDHCFSCKSDWCGEFSQQSLCLGAWQSTSNNRAHFFCPLQKNYRTVAWVRPVLFRLSLVAGLMSCLVSVIQQYCMTNLPSSLAIYWSQKGN